MQYTSRKSRSPKIRISILTPTNIMQFNPDASYLDFSEFLIRKHASQNLVENYLKVLKGFISFYLLFISFDFFFAFFLGPLPRHMEVPRLGV